MASPLTERQIKTAIYGLFAGMALSSLDSTIVNTALFRIVDELGGLRSYTWVGTAYLLTSTAATPVLGKLSDLYGRRKLYRISVAFLAAGSVLGTVATSMPQLVLARAVQGIGGGGIGALAWAIIADLVPPRERSRIVGLMTVVFGISSVIGPLVGGALVSHASWRWLFALNVPLCVVFIVKVGKALDLPFSKREVKVDLLGAALLVSGVSLLVISVSWAGPTYGWTRPQTLAYGALGLALAGWFLVTELRAAEPIMPLRLLGTSHVVRVCTVTGCASNVLTLTSASFMPLFLQGVTGATPTQAGLLLLPNVVGMAFASYFGGRFTKRTGLYRPLIILGTAVGAVSALLFTQIGTSGAGLAIALLAMLLSGAGTGFSQPPSTTAIQSSVDPRDMGSASSMTVCLRSLSSTLALACAGALFTSRVQAHLDPRLARSPREIRRLAEPLRTQTLDHLAGAVTTVFWAFIPVAIVGIIAALALRATPLRERSGLAILADEAVGA